MSRSAVLTYLTYLATLPLADALWWFIENVNDEQEGRQEIFFYLRARVRDGK